MRPSRLSVEGVCKGYSRAGQWTAIVEDVTFGLSPGEIVAVTGDRLAGKTTLLKLVAGIERPDKGSIRLGDLHLSDCGDSEQSRLLGRRIMWIDRRGPKMRMEVAKFVGWPLAVHGRGRRHAERAAAQVLDRVGAANCLGRRWGDLSNWQRVLVSLARAFAGSPELVVIDDLLDALGGPATEEASDLLRSLVDASDPCCAVLMSASNLESAIHADRIWSITGRRSLKMIAGQHTEGKVVQFPDRDDRIGAGGSQHIGTS